jgi:hypothetical protein
MTVLEWIWTVRIRLFMCGPVKSELESIHKEKKSSFFLCTHKTVLFNNNNNNPIILLPK